VLKPSKVIKTGFETETIITVNGKSHTGLVKEQGNELRVITPDSEVKVPKKDVEQRTVDKLSLMPVGQHRGLSLREFADLIAYLKSLK
jgi:putative heme-binding domain-containing protein